MVAPKSLPGGGSESHSSDGSSEAPSRARRLWLGAASIGFSLATTALLLKPARPTDGSTPFGDFRGFFAFDQLSYAAIATTAATGNLSRVEPFTQTGVSYYPSLWYQFLGLFSWYLDVGIPAVWTIFGSLTISIMVIVLGALAIAISGNAWAAALVGPALWIGPLAMVFTDNWYLPLDSHAKLWGPYGLLFPLNAESVGICLAATSIALSLWASTVRLGGSLRLSLFGFSALVLGLLANIHTYAFLVATTVILAWLFVLGLQSLSRRGRALAVSVSLGLALGIAVAARLFSDTNGSVVVFALMAMVAGPGIAPLFLRHRSGSIILGLIFFAGASPQLVHLLVGLLNGDEFLIYRQVQSEQLSVSWFPFVLATIPIAGWIASLILAMRTTYAPGPMKAVVWACLLAIPLLTFNDLWGFSQEPYRMWIGAVALTSVLLVLPTAFLLSTSTSMRSNSRWLLPVASIAVACVALSWWNLGGFREAVTQSGSVKFGSSRLDAMRALATGAKGLILAGKCVDPQELKTASGARVAFYNPGLAWPERKVQIDKVLMEVETGQLSYGSLVQASIGFLLTDSQCDNSFSSKIKSSTSLVMNAPYVLDGEQGSLSLWRIL